MFTVQTRRERRAFFVVSQGPLSGLSEEQPWAICRQETCRAGGVCAAFVSHQASECALEGWNKVAYRTINYLEQISVDMAIRSHNMTDRDTKFSPYTGYGCGGHLTWVCCQPNAISQITLIAE